QARTLLAGTLARPLVLPARLPPDPALPGPVLERGPVVSPAEVVPAAAAPGPHDHPLAAVAAMEQAGEVLCGRPGGVDTLGPRPQFLLDRVPGLPVNQRLEQPLRAVDPIARVVAADLLLVVQLQDRPPVLVAVKLAEVLAVVDVVPEEDGVPEHVL